MPRKVSKGFNPPSNELVAKKMGFSTLDSLGRHLQWLVADSAFVRLGKADVRRGDDLELDPACPMQSLQEFKENPDMRDPRKCGRTIYLVVLGEPESLRFDFWLIAEYLQAYYFGMKVKVLPHYEMTEWHESKRAKGARAKFYVGMKSPTGVTRITTRIAVDAAYSQLSVNDLIDGLIAELETLPDAYCIIGITPEDIFESQDDLFIAGRAYGGSGAGVINAFRYRPDMLPIGPSTKKQASEWTYATGIDSKGPKEDAVWLERVCKTTAHELGHCLGLDHCTAFHCSMQGSASLDEDLRQPPLLCPLELVKLQHLLGWKDEDILARYASLLSVVQKEAFKGTIFGTKYAAWLQNRIRVLEDKHAEDDIVVIDK